MKVIKNLKKEIFSGVFIIICGSFFLVLLPFLISNVFCNFSLKKSLFWIETKGFIIELKDYIYYYFYAVAAMTTGVLSYAILKVNISANEREEKRDEQIKIDSALVTYYDLFIGFSDLQNLSKSINEELEPKPSQLYFNNDWIKSVALIEKVTEEDRKLIYEIYGRMLSISKILEKGKQSYIDSTSMGYIQQYSNARTEYVWPSELYNEINNVANEVFESIYPKGFYHKFETFNILKKKYRDVLLKIKPKEIELVQPKEKVYFENGNVFYKIKYMNDIPISGIMFDTNNENNIFFCGTYIFLDSEYKIVNGFNTIINHQYTYAGEVDEKGQPFGVGVQIDNKYFVCGEWTDQISIKGKIISRSDYSNNNEIVYFQGTFKYNVLENKIEPKDGEGYICKSENFVCYYYKATYKNSNNTLSEEKLIKKDIFDIPNIDEIKQDFYKQMKNKYAETI